MPPVPGGEARAAMVDSLMKTGAGPGDAEARLRGRAFAAGSTEFFLGVYLLSDGQHVVHEPV
jgi:hypothetical protein